MTTISKGQDKINKKIEEFFKKQSFRTWKSKSDSDREKLFEKIKSRYSHVKFTEKHIHHPLGIMNKIAVFKLYEIIRREQKLCPYVPSLNLSSFFDKVSEKYKEEIIKFPKISEKYISTLDDKPFSLSERVGVDAGSKKEELFSSLLSLLSSQREIREELRQRKFPDIVSLADIKDNNDQVIIKWIMATYAANWLLAAKKHLGIFPDFFKEAFENYSEKDALIEQITKKLLDSYEWQT